MYEYECISQQAIYSLSVLKVSQFVAKEIFYVSHRNLLFLHMNVYIYIVSCSTILKGHMFNVYIESGVFCTCVLLYRNPIVTFLSFYYGLIFIQAAWGVDMDSWILSLLINIIYLTMWPCCMCACVKWDCTLVQITSMCVITALLNCRGCFCVMCRLVLAFSN